MYYCFTTAVFCLGLIVNNYTTSTGKEHSYSTKINKRSLDVPSFENTTEQSGNGISLNRSDKKNKTLLDWIKEYGGSNTYSNKRKKKQMSNNPGQIRTKTNHKLLTSQIPIGLLSVPKIQKSIYNWNTNIINELQYTKKRRKRYVNEDKQINSNKSDNVKINIKDEVTSLELRNHDRITKITTSQNLNISRISTQDYDPNNDLRNYHEIIQDISSDLRSLKGKAYKINKTEQHDKLKNITMPYNSRKFLSNIKKTMKTKKKNSSENVTKINKSPQNIFNNTKERTIPNHYSKKIKKYSYEISSDSDKIFTDHKLTMKVWKYNKLSKRTSISFDIFGEKITKAHTRDKKIYRSKKYFANEDKQNMVTEISTTSTKSVVEILKLYEKCIKELNTAQRSLHIWSKKYLSYNSSPRSLKKIYNNHDMLKRTSISFNIWGNYLKTDRKSEKQKYGESYNYIDLESKTSNTNEQKNIINKKSKQIKDVNKILSKLKLCEQKLKKIYKILSNYSQNYAKKDAFYNHSKKINNQKFTQTYAKQSSKKYDLSKKNKTFKNKHHNWTTKISFSTGKAKETKTVDKQNVLSNNILRNFSKVEKLMQNKFKTKGYLRKVLARTEGKKLNKAHRRTTLERKSGMNKNKTKISQIDDLLLKTSINQYGILNKMPNLFFENNYTQILDKSNKIQERKFKMQGFYNKAQYSSSNCETEEEEQDFSCEEEEQIKIDSSDCDSNLTKSTLTSQDTTTMSTMSTVSTISTVSVTTTKIVSPWIYNITCPNITCTFSDVAKNTLSKVEEKINNETNKIMNWLFKEENIVKNEIDKDAEKLATWAADEIHKDVEWVKKEKDIVKKEIDKDAQKMVTWAIDEIHRDAEWVKKEKDIVKKEIDKDAQKMVTWAIDEIHKDAEWVKKEKDIVKKEVDKDAQKMVTWAIDEMHKDMEWVKNEKDIVKKEIDKDAQKMVTWAIDEIHKDAEWVKKEKDIVKKEVDKDAQKMVTWAIDEFHKDAEWVKKEKDIVKKEVDKDAQKMVTWAADEIHKDVEWVKKEKDIVKKEIDKDAQKMVTWAIDEIHKDAEWVKKEKDIVKKEIDKDAQKMVTWAIDEFQKDAEWVKKEKDIVKKEVDKDAQKMVTWAIDEMHKDMEWVKKEKDIVKKEIDKDAQKMVTWAADEIHKDAEWLIKQKDIVKNETIKDAEELTIMAVDIGSKIIDKIKKIG